MGNCPSETSLTAWTSTEKGFSDTFLEHLDTCTRCRKVVAALVVSVPIQPPRLRGNTDAEPVLLTRGSSLGRYLVLELLGVGGMGAVWAAYDPQLDRRVALKLLRSFSSESVEAKQELVHEAQSMAKLNHPNVRGIYDATFEGQQAFLVMELVDGQTLSQWLTTPRTWREVASTFLDAGRGLAAAHQAGLVHRDFKPDNILIADDGRVRVTDFGLAHSLADRSADPVGTIAFMAPEQRSGQRTNELSDQFSYCVSFEAALPSGAPTWLKRLIAVGQEIKPENRHPHLQTMLGILEKRLSPRRSTWLLASAVAVVGLSFGLVKIHERSQICAPDAQALAEIWNVQVQKGIETAFTNTGLSFAHNTWEKTKQALDGYSQSWVVHKSEACEATRLRREQSENALDVRMACFARRRAEFASLTELLLHADATVVEKSVQAVAGLVHRGMCEHPLEAMAPPNSVEFQRAEALLVKAQTLSQVGKYADAFEVAVQAREASQKAGHLPTVAAALFQEGDLLVKKGKNAEAEKVLFDAIWAADRAKVSEMRVRAWLSLSGAFHGREQKAEAFRALESAAAALDGLEFPPAGLTAVVELNLGEELRRSDQASEAIDHYQKARQSSGGNAHLNVQIDSAMGSALAALGKYKDAEALLRRAVDEIQALEGVEHPATASAMIQLANALKDQDQKEKFEEAREYYLKALQIRLAVFGPKHRNVGDVYNALGNVSKYLGRFDEAHQYLTRALELTELLNGKDNPAVAIMLNNLGTLLMAQSNPEAALPLFRRAAQIFEKQHAGFRSIAATRINVSDALVQLHQPQAAIGEAKTALRALPSESHTMYPDATLAVARALWAAGQKQSARIEYLKLANLLEGREAISFLQAGLKLGQARGLNSTDRARAVALAREARAIFITNPADRRYVDEVDDFLSLPRL